MHPWTKCARITALLAIVTASLVCGCTSVEMHRKRDHGFASDKTKVEILTATIQGKNVFIPSTIVLTSGRATTLAISNATGSPHGFSIAGLEIQETVGSGGELEVALPGLEGRRVYDVICHLHPRHQTATLVVLPDR